MTSRHNKPSLKTLALLLVCYSNIVFATQVMAKDAMNMPDDESTVVYQKNWTPSPSLKSRSNAWSFSFDNDALVPGGRDQDYTYGLAASISNVQAPEHTLTLETPLDWINNRTGFSVLGNRARSYTTELGAYGFTPENMSHTEANYNDRPYASLVYLSNTKEFSAQRPEIVWHTTLTLGILGLDIVGDLQQEVHSITDSDNAAGWKNQISDGGEFTARYSIARQKLWSQSNPDLEIKTSIQGSIGYLTELSYSVSIRAGRIATRWQTFTPELAGYREHSVPVVFGSGFQESFFNAGLLVKARIYNAFLQGQFKDSVVSFSSNDLNHGILEAWLGYTHHFGNGYRVNYTLRGHTSELKVGDGDRTVLWGGLSLAKSFH